VRQAMTQQFGDSPPLPVGEGAERVELESLFREHRGRVYRAAYRVTGNASDAEDVLQTIFLRLLKRRDQIELGPGAHSYFYRAAVNAGLDLLRSRARAPAVDLDDATSELEASQWGSLPPPDSRIERRELGDRLRTALAGLSPKAAEIFALRHFEDIGNTEIAKMLGISRSSIAVILHRTRIRLRKELGTGREDLS
jgi:RNA polymerase sigma-70 factor (ECF subfamily)